MLVRVCVRMRVGVLCLFVSVCVSVSVSVSVCVCVCVSLCVVVPTTASYDRGGGVRKMRSLTLYMVPDAHYDRSRDANAICTAA